MRIKHLHKWIFNNTYIGTGMNGTVRRCDCGARKRSGVAKDRMVHEYARPGLAFKPVAPPTRFW